MNLQSSSKTVQSAVASETTANWQDFVVEELSDEAQAAVCGGKKPTSTTPTTSTDIYYPSGAPDSWSSAGMG